MIALLHLAAEPNKMKTSADMNFSKDHPRHDPPINLMYLNLWTQLPEILNFLVAVPRVHFSKSTITLFEVPGQHYGGHIWFFEEVWIASRFIQKMFSFLYLALQCDKQGEERYTQEVLIKCMNMPMILSSYWCTRDNVTGHSSCPNTYLSCYPSFQYLVCFFIDLIYWNKDQLQYKA